MTVPAVVLSTSGRKPSNGVMARSVSYPYGKSIRWPLFRSIPIWISCTPAATTATAAVVNAWMSTGVDALPAASRARKLPVYAVAAVSPVMVTVVVADVKGQLVPPLMLASYAATATLSAPVGQTHDADVVLGVTVTAPVIVGGVVSAAFAAVVVKFCDRTGVDTFPAASRALNLAVV